MALNSWRDCDELVTVEFSIVSKIRRHDATRNNATRNLTKNLKKHRTSSDHRMSKEKSTVASIVTWNIASLRKVRLAIISQSNTKNRHINWPQEAHRIVVEGSSNILMQDLPRSFLSSDHISFIVLANQIFLSMSHMTFFSLLPSFLFVLREATEPTEKDEEGQLHEL